MFNLYPELLWPFLLFAVGCISTVTTNHKEIQTIQKNTNHPTIFSVGENHGKTTVWTTVSLIKATKLNLKFYWLSHLGLCLSPTDAVQRPHLKQISLMGLFARIRTEILQQSRTCPGLYTSLQKSSSHVQHSAILCQVFMGKERHSYRARVRIRQQSAFKSSETIKPFPSFSLMRPSSKFAPLTNFSYNEST